MVGQRVQNLLPDDPLIRRVGDRFDKRSSNVRNRQSDRVKLLTPSLPRRNIGDGMAVGAIGAAIEDIVSSYIPIGSETEISGVRSEGDGVIYTVNTNAPFRNMAEAEAFMESGTGFASFITDRLDVRSVEILWTRPARDTYQIEVYVED